MFNVLVHTKLNEQNHIEINVQTTLIADFGEKYSILYSYLYDFFKDSPAIGISKMFEYHNGLNTITGIMFSDAHRAAAMTLRTVLLSIQALLASPEPNDPQDAVVARQYLDDRRLFEQTARHWTAVYGGGPQREEDECVRKVKQLIGMGFKEVRSASEQL